RERVRASNLDRIELKIGMLPSGSMTKKSVTATAKMSREFKRAPPLPLRTRQREARAYRWSCARSPGDRARHPDVRVRVVPRTYARYHAAAQRSADKNPHLHSPGAGTHPC